MKLFIAEKPSAAQYLAEQIGNPKKRGGYWECDGAYVVPCRGHMLELAEPELYNPIYKQWSLEHLPVLPAQWKLLPKKETKDQLQLIGELLKRPDVDIVVHAGDPDDEGQAIVDDVLLYFKSKKPTLRYWVSAMDEDSIQKGLKNLVDNAIYVPYGISANARRRADWLRGMNCTRGFTLKAEAEGRRGVVPVGRVQTPTLAIVVEHDRKIRTFESVAFYVIIATVQHANSTFNMRWNPSSDDGLDDDRRLVDRKVAAHIVEKIANSVGVITECSTNLAQAYQPKGFSLAGITRAASKMFGYTAQEILDACQALYDSKLLSYPRTDCEYLPESQHEAGVSILDALKANMPALARWINQADSNEKSRTWNDKKITAHHAIIPTRERADLSRLNPKEQNIYQLVARSYIAQFFPVHEFYQTSLAALINDELFAASGKVVKQMGWKALYSNEQNEGEEEDQALPEVALNDRVSSIDVKADARKTKPPAYFTEGTLITAMENIYKYVEDKQERILLKDGDGIGTPATRASIIGELKRRGFLENKGKFIVATSDGENMIDSLPAHVKSASITAHFQRGLTAIKAGQSSLDTFLADEIQFVIKQIDLIKQHTPTVVTYTCPSCNKGSLRRFKRKDGSAHFWSCSGWKQGCKFSAVDDNATPVLTK